jgi:hypothetical protein
MNSRLGSTVCSHWFDSGVLTIVLLLSPLAAAARQQPLPQQQTEPPASGDNLDTKPANPPSLITPLKVQREASPYNPISRRQRLRWFITNSIGPSHLTGGLFTSAFGTALDRPKEYGPHWGGFADRYGMRMTGIVTGNAVEASVGYYFHEDPRYFRVPERAFKSRIANVARLTVVARHDDGTYGPAYARYIAISGNNFLSNTWRVSSEANVHMPFSVPARVLPEEWPRMPSKNFGRTLRSAYFTESDNVARFPPTKKARRSIERARPSFFEWEPGWIYSFFSAFSPPLLNVLM